MPTKKTRRNTAYGFPNPLKGIQAESFIMQRDPTIADQGELGQEWLNTLTQNIWFLTNNRGQSTWTQMTSVGSPQVVNYVSYNSGVTPNYLVTSTDDYISVRIGGVTTVSLPNTTTTGRIFVVKDQLGQATNASINVTTVGGAVLIDGFTSFPINQAYQSVQFIFNGTNYEVF